MIKDENMTMGKASAVFARAMLSAVRTVHWSKSSGLGLW